MQIRLFLTLALLYANFGPDTDSPTGQADQTQEPDALEQITARHLNHRMAQAFVRDDCKTREKAPAEDERYQKGKIRYNSLTERGMEECLLMEVDYRLDFTEGFRGESDISGSVYSGKRPDVGWIWQLKQYQLVRDVEGDNVNTSHTVVLASSNSVFPDLTAATENAEQVLRILEPDMGRHSPINTALKKLATFGP